MLAAIGLVQGLVLWAVHPLSEESSPWTMAGVGFVLAGGLAGMFTWTGRDVPRWVVVTAGLGLLVGAVTGWIWTQLPHGDAAGPFQGDDARIFTWMASAFVATYILVPFAQIGQRSGALRFPYGELFHHSWNNVFVGVIAQFLLNAVSAVFMLWGQLFKLVGIELFYDFFTSWGFLYCVYPTVWGYGIALGLEADRITNALRRVLFAIYIGILPLLSLVALLFASVLPFTGLQPLWDTGFATSLLLALVFAQILLVNAVFQTGDGAPPYTARALRVLVEAATLLAPFYVGVAAYATWLRIEQYGLTPQRVWGVVLVAIAAGYAFGYAGGIAVRYGSWLAVLRRVNVGMSLVVVALLVALHTPVADPLRLSARNQIARLLDGVMEVAEFDFGLLRFELGWVGHAALDRIAESGLEGVGDELERVRAAESYWAWREGRQVVALERLALVPPLDVVPPGFSTAVAQTHCGQGSGRHCALFQVDLDGGKEPPELCVAQGAPHVHYVRCFGLENGVWAQIGHHSIVPGSTPVELPQLVDGTVTPRSEAPRYRDLRFGEAIYRLGR